MRPRPFYDVAPKHRQVVAYQGSCAGSRQRLHPRASLAAAAAGTSPQAPTAATREPLAAPVIPDYVHARNREFAAQLRGKLVLAPLTKGGNKPFRQLCCDFGCEATMSEMAFARQLIK